MSKLAAWYPLHKDTKDWSGNEKHLTPVNYDNPESIAVNDGILGKCYGKAARGLREHLISPPMGLTGDQAMFCFINIADLGSDNSANGIVTNHLNARSTGMGITLKAINSTTFRASVNTGAGSSVGRTWDTYYGATDLFFNEWHHIGYTWEQSSRTLCIYVDGKLDYRSVGVVPSMDINPDSEVALFLWSLSYHLTSYQLAMKLQDVRIYNEIPSLKEINWASKACMLHWNFNEQAYGSLASVQSWEGYDPYHTMLATTPSSVKLLMLSNGTIAIKPISSFYHDNLVRISGYASKNGSPITVTSLSSYNPDAEVRNDPVTGWFISEYSSPNAHLIHTDTGFGSLVDGDIVEIKDLRVELLKGYSGTDGSVRDATGLKHDGLATVDLPVYAKTESNLGNGCYYFEDDSIYSKEKLAIGGGNMITMATWIKTVAIGNENYHVLMTLKETLAELTITNTGQLRFGFSVGGSRKVANFGGGLLDGSWHHIAATFDGSVIRGYIDGLEVGSIQAAGSMPVYEYELAVGQFYKPKGNLSSNKLYQSDVLLFGTALSADDVKTLYRQRLTVDKKAQVHATEFVESTGNTRVSRRGQLVTRTLMENKFKPNLLDYSTWVIGETSDVNFSRNGAITENIINVDKNPHGMDDVMWQAMKVDTEQGPDGGFNTAKFDIDNAKAYRFTCWFNRRVLGNGRYYWGLHGYSAGGSVALENLNGSENSNPYFYHSEANLEDEWFLVVGYAYPAGTTNKAYSDDGIYLKDGTKIVNEVNGYRWASDATQANARAYLYFSSNTSTKQHFYRPRVDLVDGSEPSLKDILKCQEHIPLINFYDDSGRYQGKKFGLGKDVIAKEFIEI